MRELNAVVQSIFLGYEDHGILTCLLDLKLTGGGCQGFGNWDLRGENRMARFVAGILVALGAESWEKLPGVKLRVRQEDGLLVAVGHFLEERWYEPRVDLKSVEVKL